MLMTLLLYGVILMGCIHAYRRLESVRCIKDGYTGEPDKENEGDSDRTMQTTDHGSKREERKRKTLDKDFDEWYNELELFIDAGSAIT